MCCIRKEEFLRKQNWRERYIYLILWRKPRQFQMKCCWKGIWVEKWCWWVVTVIKTVFYLFLDWTNRQQLSMLSGFYTLKNVAKWETRRILLCWHQSSSVLLHQERGILKEAKLERMIHVLDPLKEAMPVSNDEMLLKRQLGRNVMQVCCYCN